jgi:mycothiol synthase
VRGNILNYQSLKFESLTENNLEAVYQFCEENVLFISQSLKIFNEATLQSEYFKPNFSIVASDSQSNIIAFFMIVFRNSFTLRRRRKVAILKFFVVNKHWRGKGLGSQIFNELISRIKKSNYKCFRMKIEVMVSMPEYWYPGLDPRQTEALFFLKKHGFKKGKEKINLCINLETIMEEQPPSEVNGYLISRATLEDEEELVSLRFMPKLYRLGPWSNEIALSFQHQPVTTFIARDPKTRKILGWATHSVGFPGAFGPTGIERKNRGIGLGGILLKWCMWDLKQMGLKTCVVRWVRENTAYFYSKIIGARICEFYWEMKKRF